MAIGLSVLYMMAAAVVGQALTPSTFLTTVDKDRLKALFESAQPYNDPADAYYSVNGLQLLGATLPKEQELCKTITSSVDVKSVASWFYASSAAKSLSSCKISSGDSQNILTAAVSAESSVADLYYAYFALKNLGLAVDDKKVTSVLAEALKKDDSPLSHSYAFRIATEMNADVQKYFDLIEDVVAQADEVDDKYLQFEGGLFVTASVIDSAFRLAAKVGKAPSISSDKVLKFANYFLSRKHVHQLRSSYQLLAVLKALTENKFYIPVAVTLASPVSLSTTKPTLQVHVTNLMGGSLGKLIVTADSAKNMEDQSVVVNKKQFTPAAVDGSLYELDFMANKPASGFYKVTISLEPQKADARLTGTTGASVTVKVVTQVTLDNIEVGVADKDQLVAPKPTRVQYPTKMKGTVEADFHQKLIMKFTVKDKTSNSIRAHQTFVKFSKLDTKQEIIFVAEADSSNNYKFELNVGSSAKDFVYKSGKYNLELIIGDAVIDNPISWTVAEVQLTFPEAAATKEKEDQYAKKPEIQHLFREPEKRPSKTVSMAFTGLVLVPLLILLICWMKIGVNIANFPFSVSAVGFHVCLTAIFGLYYCYWTNLNMFETLRYLGLLGIPTFIFGNRLLSGIAAKRKGEKSS